MILSTGFIWRTLGATCEHDNESSGSITGGNFLAQLSDHLLLKDGYALWK
jgi:hypothetical protein